MSVYRELLLLRHGKSDWGSDAISDFDRPLSRRGRKAVKRMAWLLRAHKLVPRHILSSPAERARQTTARLCRYAEIPESRVVWNEAIYAANAGALLDVLATAPGTHGRVLIVGHNPGLEDLVAYLTAKPIEAPPGSPALPTAALVRMTLPGDWGRLESGCAKLVSIDRPRRIRGD